ncbi:MAG: DUF1330 domain-containing protein [Patescibacteria group bacterium]
MNPTQEKSFLISTATPNPENPEEAKLYSTGAMELIKRSGGTVVGRHPIVKTILGDSTPGVVLVAEFPNDQTILALFESDEYKALIPHRELGFKNVTLYVAH